MSHARPGEDRSEIGQPMHSLDVDPEVRREVPHGTEHRGLRRRDHRRERWSMVDEVWCLRGEFAPIERGVGPRDG